MTIITLVHGQHIRLADWDSMTSATVFGVRGYAAKYNEDPDVVEARAREHGHPLAGSSYTGSALTDSKAFYEKRRAEAAGAVTLAPGQRVEIEGRTYTVRAVPGNERSPRNSDPIHFIAVE